MKMMSMSIWIFLETDEEFTTLVVQVDNTNLGVFKEHKDFEF